MNCFKLSILNLFLNFVCLSVKKCKVQSFKIGLKLPCDPFTCFTLVQIYRLASKSKVVTFFLTFITSHSVCVVGRGRDYFQSYDFSSKKKTPKPPAYCISSQDSIPLSRGMSCRAQQASTKLFGCEYICQGIHGLCIMFSTRGKVCLVSWLGYCVTSNTVSAVRIIWVVLKKEAFLGDLLNLFYQ